MKYMKNSKSLKLIAINQLTSNWFLHVWGLIIFLGIKILK